jgi:hypothetical protein
MRASRARASAVEAAGEAHEVGLGAALGKPLVGEGVAEHVGVQALDPGLEAAAADDLRGPALRVRAPRLPSHSASKLARGWRARTRR